jgi:hypothetical protein
LTGRYETAIADDKVKRRKMDKLIQQQPPIALRQATSRDAGLIDPEEKD